LSVSCLILTPNRNDLDESGARSHLASHAVPVV